LTQAKFAARIGLTQNVVANYEIGRRNPSNSVVALICREFSVNETWLRDGSGEMFVEKSRSDALKEAVDRMLASESGDFRSRLVLALSRLDENQIDAVETFVRQLAGEDQAAKPAAAPDLTDDDIEAELEDYRKELLAARETRNETSVSPAPADKEA